MARVGRLAGALLAETEGAYYLVGNTKAPCDFAAHGFAPPGEIDALTRPFVRLTARAEITLAGPWLELPVEGEALARLLAERLLIARNGSVSERLVRLILGADEASDPPPAEGATSARWLAEIPTPVWAIVRDTVLRCT
jgi:hypothetical protein